MMGLMPIETLRLENALLRYGIEGARIGLCIVDDRELVILMTDLFASTLSVDADSLLGHHYRGLLTSKLRLHNFERLFAVTGPEIACEGESLNGERRMLLFEGRTFRHEKRPYRVVSVLDISDFGVTRDRLIALRRQLDAVRASIVVADARLPDMPIIYVNAQFFEVTGYRPSEVLGRNCRFLQGAGSEPEVVAQIRTAIELKRTCSVVITNYRKDGTSFRNELTISPLMDDHGQVSHFVAIQRVLTSRDPLGSELGH
jgi:PAS domain S-box-containing protein